MRPIQDVTTFDHSFRHLPPGYEHARTADLRSSGVAHTLSAHAREVRAAYCLRWLLARFVTDPMPEAIASLDRCYVLRPLPDGSLPPDTWPNGMAANLTRDAVTMYFGAAGPNRHKTLILPRFTRVYALYEAIGLGLRLGALETFSDPAGVLMLAAPPSVHRDRVQIALQQQIAIHEAARAIYHELWPLRTAPQLAAALGTWARGDVALSDAKAIRMTPYVYSELFRAGLDDLLTRGAAECVRSGRRQVPRFRRTNNPDAAAFLMQPVELLEPPAWN